MMLLSKIVFFLLSTIILINAQVGPARRWRLYRNNEGGYPGYGLDFDGRTRVWGRTDNQVLDSDKIETNLSKRQRYLYKVGRRLNGSTPIANYRNNQAAFPGAGGDFVRIDQ